MRMLEDRANSQAIDSYDKTQKYGDDIISAFAGMMAPLNISAAKWRILALFSIICLHHISHIYYNIFY